MNKRTPALGRVIELYREWAGGRNGVWSKKEAWGDLRESVVEFVLHDTTDEDLEQLAEVLFNLADEAIVHAGEKEARDRNVDQEPLPFNLPYALDAILALGDGDRCAFGDMRMPEWHRHDSKKYANVRACEDKYADWRRQSSNLMPGLEQGLSVREIIAGWGESQ